MEELDKENLVPMRMDLIFQRVDNRDDDLACLYIETEDGMIIKGIPNPDRYEPGEFEGKLAFLDKSTRTVIPWIPFKESFEKVGRIPFVRISPKQPDFCAYLKGQKSELKENWDNKYLLEPDQRRIEECLRKLSGTETLLAILYVDMEGSTRLSSELSPEVYDKIIKIFSMQMAKIIDNFEGYVLKFEGDCVIGIFPAEGTWICKCDNAIQAAIIMCSVVEDVINPVFAEKGFPVIGFHIGVDIGLVRASSFGALNVASVIDLIGYPMNLTRKIQSKAGHNEILIGKRLYELIHINWQKYCEKMNLDNWNMKDPQYKTAVYEVYRCKAKWICNCWDK